MNDDLEMPPRTSYSPSSSRDAVPPTKNSWAKKSVFLILAGIILVLVLQYHQKDQSIPPKVYQPKEVVLACSVCGFCLPVIGVGTVHYIPCDSTACCSVVQWEFRCRNSGIWFQVSVNECDHIIWGKNDGRWREYDSTLKSIGR